MSYGDNSMNEVEFHELMMRCRYHLQELAHFSEYPNLVSIYDVTQETLDALSPGQRNAIKVLRRFANEAKRQRKPILDEDYINVVDAAREMALIIANKSHPPPKYPPWKCPDGDPTCTSGMFCRHERIQIDAETLEELRNRRCPYCGEPERVMHATTNHPNMWIGGSNVYGTVWHGYADH